MIVYTVGTFDLLHVGHLALLNPLQVTGRYPRRWRCFR